MIHERGHLTNFLLTLEQRSDGWEVGQGEGGIYLTRYGTLPVLATFNADAINCPDCLRHLISVEIERQMGITDLGRG